MQAMFILCTNCGIFTHCAILMCSVHCGRNTTSKVDNVVCTISQGGTLADVLHPESSMQRLWQFALTAAAAALICCLNFLFVAATSLLVLCPLSLLLNCTHTSLK